MTRACFFVLWTRFPLFFFTSFKISPSLLCNFSGSTSSHKCWSIYSLVSNNFADIPMLIAVSILSPVSTHTLMPAYLAKWIVSGTSSCNLSSIAVEPISLKPTSILASTSATFSSLFYKASLAFWDSAFQILYSSSVISLFATNNVLSPCSANLITWPLVILSRSF